MLSHTVGRIKRSCATSLASLFLVSPGFDPSILFSFADLNLYHFTCINHNHKYDAFLSSVSRQIMEPVGNLEKPHAEDDRRFRVTYPEKPRELYVIN